MAKYNQLDNQLTVLEEQLAVTSSQISECVAIAKLRVITLFKNKLDKLSEDYSATYTEARGACKDDTATALSNRYVNFNNNLMTSMISLVNREEALLPDRPQQEVHEQRERARLAIKPPQLNLPEFDGKLENWVVFKAIFESMVHNEAQFTRTQKLHYLKAAVKIEPAHANLLNNYALTEENYETIWNAFIERYDDPRKLQIHHVKGLFTTKRMTERSAPELRNLMDSVESHIASLNNLQVTDAQFKDLIIENIVRHRLDEKTLEEWNIHIETHDPTWEEMKRFINLRWRTLSESKSKEYKSNTNKTQLKAQSTATQSKNVRLVSSNPDNVCPQCNGSHRLYSCPDFLCKSIPDRREAVQRMKLCHNCLLKGHFAQKCTNQGTCRQCGHKHHTTIHLAPAVNEKQPAAHVSTECTSSSPQIDQSGSTHCSQQSHTYTASRATLLATATVLAYDNNGVCHSLRALMDSGSDGNMIREDTARRLGLNIKPLNKTVYGIGNLSTRVEGIADITLHSHYRKQYTKHTQVEVFKEITGFLPGHYISCESFNIPHGYVLADPQFNVPQKVDLLLGADTFADCSLNGKHRLENGAFMMHTQFGWIILGSFKTSYKGNTLLSTHHYSHSLMKMSVDEPLLSQMLEKFWTIEHYDTSTKMLTKEEKKCEAIYAETVKRTNDGKYVVNLPLKENHKEIGDNFNNAMKRFKFLESKFEKQPEFKSSYIKAIREYEELGHMTEVSRERMYIQPRYYMPHHGVVKETSTTTKLRPVFDASCKSESKLSLNDVVYVGPTLQNDLYDILILFRLHTYAIKSDIEKMYRQFLVNPEHRPLQRILFRDDKTQDIKHYEMNTVTFGTACAPYLATRTLMQIADDYAERYPETCKLIRSNFYVDDFIASFQSIDECLKTQHELSIIFKETQLHLRKWSANEPRLLEAMSPSDVDDQSSLCELKALGVSWNPDSDEIVFTARSLANKQSTMTSVLSEIASLFDPLGLIAPTILVAKLFMKKLWSENLDWKSPLPEHLDEEWQEFRLSLTALDQLRIPRQVFISTAVVTQLHGFSDASAAAYGVCIYARTINQQGEIQSRLITAKSRVAPRKQITLARLELCALVLLARMINKIATLLSIDNKNVYCWSDSLITLHWIKKEPARLSTFVGNRVAAIQDEASEFKFRHVCTQHNPADIVSRGLSLVELSGNNLWWYGPDFLHTDEANWKQSLLEIDPNNPEINKETRKCLIKRQPSSLFMFIETESEDVYHIFRVIAYTLSFVKFKSTTALNDKVEFQRLGEIHTLKILQETLFPNEIRALTNKQLIDSQSPLRSLNPFIDVHGLMRVTGRIQSCNYLTADSKHPIILPKCDFAYSLVKWIHINNCHAPQSTTLAIVRQKYWPIRAKTLVRKVIHDCVKCFRTKPRESMQLMGQLPADRINATFPFNNVSVDYAGFYMMKSGITRNAPSTKVYIALFKCMTTKAIHIELVTDLSTHAFIATFNRFVARRGLPEVVHSDNATCFEGANNEFQQIFSSISTDIVNYCENKRIKWKFITARAPHMGGLWESGIKQMKHHLKRVLTDTLLTYEEFATVLCRIEAILNSRPISALSDNPDDFNFLTPGHFLIGRPLNAMPTQVKPDIPLNRLQRWEKIQQIQQQIWKSWYNDIIMHMQTVPKNMRIPHEYKLNDLVLIKEANLPPLKWLLGRITKLFPGKDGITRSVQIQTSKSILERGVNYICKLPIEDDEEIAS